jgi:hypothetical protein
MLERSPTMETWTVFVTITDSRNPNLNPRSSRLTWQVDPYYLVLHPGDDVEWVVQWEAGGCEDEPRIRVHPKGPWPFPEHPHVGQGSVGSGPMGPNPWGRYKYGIVVKCPGHPAVHIDPDMDVLD